jgi:hypothetical protein
MRWQPEVMTVEPIHSFTDRRSKNSERRVIRAAAQIGGISAAKLWYEIPIPDMGGLSPRQLVENGQTTEVMDYLALVDTQRPLKQSRYG